MCILCVYPLIKAVSHYGLSVLSMSGMGFQQQFFNLFNFAKLLAKIFCDVHA